MVSKLFYLVLGIAEAGNASATGYSLLRLWRLKASASWGFRLWRLEAPAAWGFRLWRLEASAPFRV